MIVSIVTSPRDFVKKKIRIPIKTESKMLGDVNKLKLAGVDYAARLFLTVEGSSVSFRARFNKRSNFIQGGDNLEYPEKENELRSLFFEAIEAKLKK
jgi:hypothetical protein